MNDINAIKKMMDSITMKIFRQKKLTKEEVTFLKDLGSKVSSINLYVDEENDDEHIIIMNFNEESIEIPMDYTWWNRIVTMICFMGIDKLDRRSADLANISSVIEDLLIYPEELVELIDWCVWVYYEEIDFYGLIDKCTKLGYNETTMALLRYIHEGDGEVETTTMRL